MQWGLHEVVRIFWHESMLFYTQNKGTRDHRLAEIFFFRYGKPYNFIKTAQIIFFYQKYIFGYFLFMWCGIFSSIEWSEKNIKIFNIDKMAAVFLKILKMDFFDKATLKFFIFFGGLSIIWTTYFLSLASGKKFLPIEKNIFRKNIKIVNFFKNYRRKE